MEKTLTFDTAQQVSETYGNRHENLELAEEKFGVKIVARDGWMKFEGDPTKVELASKFFETMEARAGRGCELATPTSAICSRGQALEGWTK